jgi:hypothetical protein
VHAWGRAVDAIGEVFFLTTAIGELVAVKQSRHAARSKPRAKGWAVSVAVALLLLACPHRFVAC